MSYKLVKIKDKAPSANYSEAFKKSVVAEYEKGLLSKDRLQEKYGIRGHSRLLEWCRKYGKLHYPQSKATGRPMKDPQKQRIKELEKALEEARLKLVAYEKLIALAEKEEGISILKKGEARQLVSLPKPTRGK
jgi:transposase-like protein